MRTIPNMPRTPRLQAGFSLIELMITLLLGLVVVAAAGGMFLSNKRVYNSTETVGRIQENARVAFELMSRDLREAGGNPCSSAATLVNQMTSGDNSWWLNFANGLRGYEGDVAVPALTTGTGVAQRVEGTDAVEVHMSRDSNIRVVSHAQPSAVIQVNDPGNIAPNDVLVICNMDYIFIFQATAVQDSDKLQHNGGTSLNCSQEFQHERNCVPGASGDKGYCFAPGAGAVNPNCDEYSNSPAYVARVETVRWYIGNNGRGGRSLYRQLVVNRSSTETPNVIDTQEIAEGVQDLSLTYLSNGGAGYVDATTVGANWAGVVAVKADLNMAGTEGALSEREVQGTDGEALNRWTSNIVNLRNREATL